MVCSPPDPPRSLLPVCEPDLAWVRSVHDPVLIDALFNTGRASRIPGHYRGCIENLSLNTVRTLIRTLLPRAGVFRMESQSSDEICDYTSYKFDTRSDDGGIEFSPLCRFGVCYHIEHLLHPTRNGADWDTSKLHVYRCRDATAAESLLKQWLEDLWPWWIPHISRKKINIGQCSFMQDVGIIYWIRDNVFLKLSIHDNDVDDNTVEEVARAIDQYLAKTSVPLQYEHTPDDIDTGTTIN
ncbi:hypothetical protein Dda_5341 [Drechslerella dactyloides]|uniref:Uncharacterized protein n=1 Tax=Drechslerella dactyloides TaxID=74499 RepID=A0AAD6NK45_DREDA|nr:hypothetical protein Dda_5341 [Drechslerella dactyloides]